MTKFENINSTKMNSSLQPITCVFNHVLVTKLVSCWT